MTLPQILFSGNSDHSSPAFVDPVMGLSNYSESAYRVSRVGSKTPTAPPYSPKPGPKQGRRYLSDSTLNTSSKAVTNFMHNHRQVTDYRLMMLSLALSNNFSISFSVTATWKRVKPLPCRGAFEAAEGALEDQTPP